MSTTTLKKITSEAKRIRRHKPKTTWKSAIKQAARRYKSGSLRPRKKRVSAVKFVEHGEKRSAKPAAVFRVIRSGKGRFKGLKRIGRRRKMGNAKQVVVVRRVTKVGRPASPRRHRMAGSGSGLKKIMPFVLLAGAALVAWQLLKPKQPQFPPGVPPLAQTGNPVRNQQTNEILQYAMAASLGIDAITKLIQSLNNRSDSDIENIYDNLDQGGGLPPTLFV